MFKTNLLPIALACLALPSIGSAAAILGSSSISSPQGSNASAPLTSIIDQSGLSATYVSGLTDFAAFTSTTTAAGLAGTGFTDTESTGPQTFTFDLGSAQFIQGIAIWNSTSIGRITQFQLYADTDNDFLNGGLTALLPDTALGDGGGLAYVFGFGTVSTQFVHLVGTASLAPPDFYGLAEVAFHQGTGTNPVPEPATLSLVAAGAALLLVSRARRRA